MLNKIIIPTTLLMLSFSHSLFASPSQCMEDWMKLYHPEFNAHEITVKEDWPNLFEAHIFFEARKADTFCTTDPKTFGYCIRTREKGAYTYPTLTPIAQEIIGQMEFCAGKRDGTGGNGCSPFDWPKGDKLAIQCYR